MKYFVLNQDQRVIEIDDYLKQSNIDSEFERFIRREQTPLCIGQKQRWFLLHLTSDAQRVRFDCSAQPEFDRCRWVDYWRPVKEVVYFKRPVYVRALKELAPLAFRDVAPPPPPSWWPRRWHHALNDG